MIRILHTDVPDYVFNEHISNRNSDIFGSFGWNSDYSDRSVMKLKKGDKVIITTGKDKGKQGKIEKILPERHAVLVAGMNLYKRHVKRRDEKNPGGIVDIPRPLDTGKVALVCPSCKQPTRVGYEVSKSGKVRICRKCGKRI